MTYNMIFDMPERKIAEKGKKDNTEFSLPNGIKLLIRMYGGPPKFVFCDYSRGHNDPYTDYYIERNRVRDILNEKKTEFYLTDGKKLLVRKNNSDYEFLFSSHTGNYPEINNKSYIISGSQLKNILKLIDNWDSD